ncbi:SDR family oxidoreductase [Kineosporia babensis]|uniref:SDR family oxidoreductase n=1 Tax=Kineosporia babensis TaxID=499548 RepID=A0A9X1SWC7_9ACTN|nr:SDR family oxidoreductase [Kineosporia babensis]MCD5314621.1 SDR family oxidoreductase [Kineosporia babensis]
MSPEAEASQVAGAGTDAASQRPVVLVTGAGRLAGIAAGIAVRLAEDGWDVATTHWSPYDARMPWGEQIGDVGELGSRLREAGAQTLAVPADLSDATAPEAVFDAVNDRLGPVNALVMCHAESVDSDLLSTTVESFDRHFAVNARGTWLLVREFARRLSAATVDHPRIVALTSDHTTFNLPYGASKGALDRIVLAAAREFAHLHLSANVINPGPIDTGWMDSELHQELEQRTPLGRLGRPKDTAALVSFLLSPDGGWINGQLLYSDGGIKS